MPNMLRVPIVLFCAFFISLPVAADNDYLDQLIRQSRQLQLADDPYWHKLLHYKPNLISGVTSEVLTRSFFNSEQGRTDPALELEATLAAFFTDVVETDQQQHSQCHFIARYQWLRQRLDFDAQALPPQTCRRFNDWYATIEPYRLTLIFPAGTDNSPSSMFGHTLIRIDREHQTERTRLFSYSINYAAETAETSGLAFAINGIMGGYPGRFSIMPYYEKVNQYNQMENRDIWEYQLNFTPEEIDRLLWHAWEVGQADFAYYFFLENCSYRLLELFDIARPGMNLAAQFNWYAIPGDTVHVTLQEEGILHKAIYRPSYRTRIRHALEALDQHEHGLVLALADGRINTSDIQLARLGPQRRAMVLETAYDYVQYRHNRGGQDRETIASTSYALLRTRSEIDAPASLPEPPEPALRLDQGHGSTRLALGYVNVDRRDVLELKLRPAYHDLLDPAGGYTDGSQINFFDLTLRHDFDRDETRLHAFRLIDIYSLVARDEFFKPVSWKFNMGFERWPIDARVEDRMVYAVNAGGGLTRSLGDSLRVFGLLDATALLHHDFTNRFNLGLGPNVGVIWQPTPGWNIWAHSRVQRFAHQLHLTQVEHTIEQSFNWNRDHALRLKWQRRGPQHQTYDEYTLAWHWYFR